MGGGYFEYENHKIFDIADKIERIIVKNKIPNEYGYSTTLNDDTIAKFEWIVTRLKVLDTLVHRVDWLMSGDDDEEDFSKHWAKDGGPIVYSKTCSYDDLYDSNFIAFNPLLPNGWPPDSKPYDEQLAKDGKLK